METTGTRGVVLVEAVRHALVIGAVLLFYTGLDNYAFLALGGPPPTLWIAGFVAGSAAIAVTNLGRPSALLRSPVLAWVGWLLALTTAWGLAAVAPEAIQVIVDRFRSMALLLAFAVLVEDPRTRRRAALAVACAAVGISLLNVAEAIGVLHLDLRRIAGRAAGFYVNPNRAGLAIDLGLAMSVAALPARWRLPVVMVGAVGVAATFSRGAGLCFVTIVLALMWTGALRPLQTLARVAALAGLVAVGTGSLTAFLAARGVLNEDTLARLRFAADDSGRTGLAEKAFGLFADAPLLGQGLGATRMWDAEVSSHNVYLDLAASQGVLGLVTYPALVLAIVLAQRRVTPVATALFVAGVFSHNLLNEPYVLFAIAFSAAGPAPAAEGAAASGAAPRPLTSAYSAR
jgi:O-antigen ligase